MKPYLECNQKSMNCSSTSILWGQLFKKYENLKLNIATWKYGISFLHHSKTINSIIVKFWVLLPDVRSYHLEYQQ